MLGGYFPRSSFRSDCGRAMQVSAYSSASSSVSARAAGWVTSPSTISAEHARHIPTRQEYSWAIPSSRHRLRIVSLSVQVIVSPVPTNSTVYSVIRSGTVDLTKTLYFTQAERTGRFQRADSPPEGPQLAANRLIKRFLTAASTVLI